jgi:hypothetical protein
MIALRQKYSHGLIEDPVCGLLGLEVFVVKSFLYFFRTKHLVYMKRSAYYEVQKELSRKKLKIGKP